MTAGFRPPALVEPYGPRPIAFLDLWETGGWRIKVYGIAYAGDRPADVLVAASRAAATPVLAADPGPHTLHGVGFLGVHEGRGENQIFLDRWANENELLHTVWVSPSTAPEAVQPAPPHQNTACVWDLALQAFERDAWVEHVLVADQPDLDAYVEARCAATV